MERDSRAGTKRAEPHPIQVRLAFGGDAEHRPEFAEVVSCEGSKLLLRMLRDAGLRSFAIAESERLKAALERADVCRWQGKGALAVVSLRYRVLAIAVGPAELPQRVEMNYGVVRLENGVAIEMPSGSPDQPSWYVFAAEEVGTAG